MFIGIMIGAMPSVSAFICALYSNCHIVRKKVLAHTLIIFSTDAHICYNGNQL